MSTSDDETVVIILGSLSTLFILIAFLMLLKIVSLYNLWSRFKNLAAAMQEDLGYITLREHGNRMTRAGGFLPDTDIVFILEHSKYDRNQQPPLGRATRTSQDLEEYEQAAVGQLIHDKLQIQQEGAEGVRNRRQIEAQLGLGTRRRPLDNY